MLCTNLSITTCRTDLSAILCTTTTTDHQYAASVYSSANPVDEIHHILNAAPY